MSYIVPMYIYIAAIRRAIIEECMCSPLVVNSSALDIIAHSRTTYRIIFASVYDYKFYTTIW